MRYKRERKNTMANIYGRQFGLTKEAIVVDLYARVTFAGTGAPTLVTASSKGFKSVTRNSAGLFTFVLGNLNQIDKYVRLLSFRVANDCITNGAAPAAPLVYLSANAIAGATGSFQLTFNNTSQVATDPATGEAIYVHIALANSSAY